MIIAVAPTRACSVRSIEAQLTARWAAEPVAPCIAATCPAIRHAPSGAGLGSARQSREIVAEVMHATTRRAARTRSGGRFGP